MDNITLIGIAIALDMDAFAVALAGGLTLATVTCYHLFRFGFHFGLFQGMMPVLGWRTGGGIAPIYGSHRSLAGFCAIIADRRQDAARCPGGRFQSGVAGLSIWLSALVIGVTASAFTLGGILIGQRLGTLWSSKVECAGGLLLIAIGLKILLENTLFK